MVGVLPLVEHHHSRRRRDRRVRRQPHGAAARVPGKRRSVGRTRRRPA